MRSGGDVKSFFRQQKAHPGVAAATKPAGGVSKKQAAAAHLLRPARAAVDHRGGADATREEEEEEDTERKAREFDMDMRYGPCLGLTRAQRSASRRRPTRSAPATSRASGRAASRV